MKRIFASLFLIAVVFKTGHAQEIWSLEKCVRHALEVNYNIKQSQLNISGAKLTDELNRFARYPYLDGNGNYGLNYGRSVNPSTYTFQNAQTSYNSWSLNAGITIWNGNRINNTIKQGSFDLEASRADLEQTSNNTALSVAQAYLQILLNEEQVENAKKRLGSSQDLLAKTEKQIRAGSLAQNARYDILATIAKNEQSLVTANNNVEISYLNLKQLLVIDPDYNLRVERPQVVIPDDHPENYVLKNIYSTALNNQPLIRAGDLRVKSAELGVKVAEAAQLPQLSATASVNSNYSSSISVDDPTLGTPYTRLSPISIQDATGKVTTLDIVQSGYSNLPTKSYFGQLNDNLGEGLGLRLSVPIFDNNRNKIGVERARLTIESQRLTNDRNKQQLKSDIQTAIANARAAKQTLEAAQKTFDAQRIAFENNDKRFQIGGVSAFELSQAKSNADSAESDLTVAKYDYLFKLKIVDYYEGKPMTLK